MNRKLSLWRWMIFIMAMILLSFLYILNIYDYLSFEYPVEQEVLVVEGWLSEENLDCAKDEFLQGDYSLLVTTGMPYINGYLMGSFGLMVFDVHHKVVHPVDGNYLISVELRGTKAAGEYAHFKLYADKMILGNDHTSRRERQYAYSVNIEKPPDNIILEFDNDTFTRHQDRNIYVSSVSINNQVFPVNTEDVSYYSHDMSVLRQKLSSSQAVDAANYLKNIGVPDSLVVVVETLQKHKSKTYTSALDVRDRLQNTGYGDPVKLNVFTVGIHARRSWISYKKAFGKNAHIGIISAPDYEIGPANWWKSRTGRRKVLSETAGVIFARFFL